MDMNWKTWEHAFHYIRFTKLDTTIHGTDMADDSMYTALPQADKHQ